MDSGTLTSQSFHSSESKKYACDQKTECDRDCRAAEGRHLSQEWGGAASERVAPTRGRASQAWEQRARWLELARAEGGHGGGAGGQVDEAGGYS